MVKQMPNIFSAIYVNKCLDGHWQKLNMLHILDCLFKLNKKLEWQSNNNKNGTCIYTEECIPVWIPYFRCKELMQGY